MIKLRIHTKEEKYKKEYNKLIDGSKGILGTAQKGEAEYADSQGWLDTEEWAGEEKVKKLEKLAAKIRQNADVFVLIGVGVLIMRHGLSSRLCRIPAHRISYMQEIPCRRMP